MFEKFLIKKPKENKEIEKSKKSDKPVDLGRRDFLRKSGYGIGAGAILLSGELIIADKIAKKLLEIWEKHEQSNRVNEKDVKQEPTKEQQIIDKQDIEVIRETVKEQIKKNGKVIIDLNTKEAIRQKWYESYSPEGENYLGLEKALQRMQPWVAQMKEIFRQEGLPEEYVYLAIPESHFDMKATSKVDARGPFQFMKGTAIDYGIRIIENEETKKKDKEDIIIDGRLDPIASAKACSEFLKKKYKEFNNSWELALACYNGGYVNEYALLRKNMKERNYEDYLKWREERINNFLSSPFIEHEVKDKENLDFISKKRKVSASEIKRVNAMKNEFIRIGEVLKIPKNEENVIDYLEESLENLNYPEKFFVILKVIKENNLEEKFPPDPLQYKLAEVPKSKFSSFKYKVNKGDTLYGVAQKIKKSCSLEDNVSEIIERLIKDNGIRDARIIKPGINIKLNIPLERPMTLEELAEKKGINLEKLASINPSIIKKDREIPPGIKIRLPRV